MENISVLFKFEGEEYSDNKFEVKELGRVLESIGELFEKANKKLNKDSNLVVKIDSKFKPGSFEFIVELQQFITNTIVPVLAGTDMAVVLNAFTILSILFGEKYSLTALLKFLAGKLPKKTENLNENILVYRSDNASLEIKKEAMVLFEDKGVRKALGQAIADSLSKTGTESVQIVSTNIQSKINKNEKDSFAYILDQEDEIFDTETIEAELEIVSISFDPEKKWEFKNYKDTFSADIISTSFKRKIEAGEVFQKGDRLKAILQTDYYKTQQQVRKKRMILDVLDHIKPSAQGELFS